MRWSGFSTGWRRPLVRASPPEGHADAACVGGAARSRDDGLDLLGRLDNSLENLEGVISEVCTAEVEPDGMVFDPATVKTGRIKENAECEGVGVRFVGMCVFRRRPAEMGVQRSAGRPTGGGGGA